MAYSEPLRFVTRAGREIVLRGLPSQPLWHSQQTTSDAASTEYPAEHAIEILVRVAEQILQHESWCENYEWRTNKFDEQDTLGTKKRLLELLDRPPQPQKQGKVYVPLLSRPEALAYLGEDDAALQLRTKVYPGITLGSCHLLHSALLKEIRFLHYDLYCEYGEWGNEDFDKGDTILHSNGVDGTNHEDFSAWEFAELLEICWAIIHDRRLIIALDRAQSPDHPGTRTRAFDYCFFGTAPLAPLPEISPELEYEEEIEQEATYYDSTAITSQQEVVIDTRNDNWWHMLQMR